MGDSTTTPGKKTSPSPSESGAWIKPANRPFVKGETAKVVVVLSEPAPAGGVKAKLECPAFSSDVEVTIPEKETTAEVEVTFSNPVDGTPLHHITLTAPEGCVVGGEFMKDVEVYPDRPVGFPRTGAIRDPGPFIKDDMVVLNVALDLPAPEDKATAKLTGPFDDVELEFEPGETSKTLMVTFTTENDAEQDITVEPVNNCVAGDRNLIKVLVRKPKVSLDEAAMTEAGPAFVGDYFIRLKLDSPAPRDGCDILVKSVAFAKDGYVAVFPERETETYIQIKDDPALVGQAQTVTVELGDANKKEGFGRCRIGDPPSYDLEIKHGPRIGFVKDKKMTPAGPDFNEGDSATLHIKPSQVPESDLLVTVKSTAFGGKVYFVVLPKGSEDAVDRDVVLCRGYPEGTDGVPEQKIILIPPEGWMADPTRDGGDSQDDPEPNGHVILVKVKAPPPVKDAHECSSKAKPKGDQPTRVTVEQQSSTPTMPDLDKPCNLHVVNLTEKHGTDGGEPAPAQRGADKDGKFQVVKDESMADQPDAARIYTNARIPVIQVTAGRETFDPHLDDPEKTPHHTVIAIELDARDTYCDQQFIFGRETAELQHPILFVQERTLAPKAASSSGNQKPDDVDTMPFISSGQIETNPILKIGDGFGGSLSQSGGSSRGGSHGTGGSRTAPTSGSSGNTPPSAMPSPYEWKPLIPAPGNIRPNIDEADGNSGVIFEFPVYQAHQSWHEKPKPASDKTGDQGNADTDTPPSGDIEASEALKDKNQGKWHKDLLSGFRLARTQPRQYLIELESCGCPDMDSDPMDPTGPTRSIKAGVEVYPSDEFCLAFSYLPKTPRVKLGLEGLYYNPEKGEGETGLVPSEESPTSAEAEAVTGAIKTNVGWQVETEPQRDETNSDGDGETDDPSKTGDQENPVEETESQTLDQPDETADHRPTRGTGAAFLSDAGYLSMKTPEGGEPTPPQPYSPTRVLYPFDQVKDSISAISDEAGWNNLAQRVINGLEKDGEVEDNTDSRSTGDGTDPDKDSGEAEAQAENKLETAMLQIDQFDLKLIRNGRMSPQYTSIVKSIGGFIQTKKEILAVFNELTGNWVPANGWGLHLDLRFLEGSLCMYWGWKEYEDHRVFKWFAVNADLTLIHLDFSLDFSLRKTILMQSFELVVFASLKVESTLKESFERQTPDTAIPEWLESWNSVVGLAEGRCNMALNSGNGFNVNGVVKTGFDLKWRMSSGLINRFGIDYEIYWGGLSVDATVKILGFKEKSFELKLIKGSAEDTPWRKGSLFREENPLWWNLKKLVNKVWVQADYRQDLLLQRINAYQTIQLEMAGASKKDPPYTLLTDILPGYRFDGDDTDISGKSCWAENKRKWDAQWKAVTSAFHQETKKVYGRSSIFRYKLADRLARKVEQIETFRDDYIQSIRRFDGIKAEIIQLTKKITAAEDENRADSKIPNLIERSAADLSRKVSNAYDEISTKRNLKDFDALIKDLRYYAGKRDEW